MKFNSTAYYDSVTKKWTDAQGKELTDQDNPVQSWAVENGTKDEGSFGVVVSNHYDGYHIVSVKGHEDSKDYNDGNGNVVGFSGINHKSSNFQVDVTYEPDAKAPDQGSLKVIFHDDTTNQDIPGYGTTISTTDVGTKVSYTPNTQITDLENKGYDYVRTDGTIPTTIIKGDTVVTIHVKHATTPVTPEHPGKPGDKVPKDPKNPNEPEHKYPDNYVPQTLTKTITRDVIYQYKDGSQAHAPVQQKVKFTGNGVLDLVTGQYVTVGQDGKLTPGKITWTQDQDGYSSVPAINHDGYYVSSVSKTNTSAKVDDDTSVAGETVTPTSQNSTIIITLTKNPDNPVPTTGSITYIDETTGKTLKVDPINGNVGDKITYTTQDKINDYINKGYKLDSSDFKDGNETFQKDGNKFTVKLVHDTVTINPQNPGKPGDKINPNDPDPNAPKWQEGTDKDSLTKIGTQTIHYQGAGNQTPSDNVSHVEFDHEIVIDRVTGKTLEDHGWKINGDNYESIPTPNVPGYTPDQYQAGGFHVSVDPKTGEGNIDTSYVVNYTQNGPDTTPLPNSNTEPATTTPAPTKPTEPKQPTKPSTPDEGSPEIPDEPDIPETPKRHHHKKQTNAPKPANHWSENNAPHGQSWNSNVAPHAQGLNSDETVLPNGEVVNSKGQVVGYVDKNGVVHHTLPQTGENENEDLAAMIAGGVAVSMSLIGLAGVKKRRTN